MLIIHDDQTCHAVTKYMKLNDTVVASGIFVMLRAPQRRSRPNYCSMHTKYVLAATQAMASTRGRNNNSGRYAVLDARVRAHQPFTFHADSQQTTNIPNVASVKC